ncbi:MAG: redoxin domain-containing protein [Phycisphaerales bacterium]|nr:MAG: redoxin domain-containing protein [Phycisphaerales bacterium]
MNKRLRPARLAMFAAAVLATGSPTMAAEEPAGPPTIPPAEEPAQPKPPPVNPKWLEKLERLDRALLDELIGYAPPPFTEDLKWIGSDPLTWDKLRGTVVIVQSWTSKSRTASRWPARTAKALKDYESGDVRILALHTPENADKAETILTRRPMEMPVIVDPVGGFCDALGVYKKPVNIIIDRQGAVRYAGLNSRGLLAAVASLVEEEFDPKVSPPGRPVPEDPTGAEFPPVTGKVDKARDIRGQRAPNLFVEKWITPQVDLRGKVVVIDFWATWCSFCRSSIPHLNDLADRYGSQVCFVGLSDETPRKFEEGLEKHNLKVRDFRYALALDRSTRTKQQIGITAIPHAIVVSSDWVVRWQGHPMRLTAEMVEQIIRADRAAGSVQGRGLDGYRRRWTGG